MLSIMPLICGFRFTAVVFGYTIQWQAAFTQRA